MAKSKLVLIVEDEPDLARLVAFHLKRRGLRTIVASDGAAAINLAFQRQPDLVILDVMLPALQGLEVCQAIKSNPLTSETPVLLLTALATIDDKLRGFGVGADDYLTKPFDMSELVVRAFALLRRGAVAMLAT